MSNLNIYVDSEVTLKIEKLCYQGQGLGFVDKFAVFVDQALLDYEVKAQIVAVHKNYAQATVKAVLSKPKHFRAPHCKYAESCGGCQWQHIPYDLQQVWKKSFIHDPLVRISKLPISHESIELSPATNEFDYRNRIQLRGRVLESGHLQVGYFKKNSHDLISIDSCSIAEPGLNLLISELTKIKLAKRSKIAKFRLELQILPGPAKAIATLHPVEMPNKALADLLQALQKFETVLWAGFSSEKSQTFVFEEEKGKTYFTKAGLFTQVNIPENHKLRSWVKKIVTKQQPKTILDLFCGSGNLSLGLAGPGRKILGIESNPSSIAVAEEACKQQELPDLRYLSENADKFMRNAVKQKTRFSLVIADPPRAGLGAEVCAGLAAICEKDLLLVSCDPNTLARDLKVLLEFFTVVEVGGFDFFPQTYHVETVVWMQRKS